MYSTLQSQALAELTNAELLARVADGEATAWGALVERYIETVWRVTGNYGFDSAIREDIVQTTWLRLYDKAASVTHPERLGGWLCRVARNESIDVLRRRSRLVGLSDEWDDPDTDDAIAELDLDADSNRALLRSAWSKLSVPCRELLALCMQDPPLSYDEIAEALEMRRGSVGPTRSRCLESLRRSSGIARLLVERQEKPGD